MENQAKKDRITELVELLNKARYAYEQEDREIMSNFEYDALYDELQALEEETGYVMAQSPTINVGYEVLSELPKERHVEPMLSLNKTKDREELKAFLGDKEGLLSWKMDGLTNVLTYRNGELVKAVTRGSGEIGEIITNNAKVYKNIPVKIPYQGELVLRGEAIITYSEFERINAEIEDVNAKYKNPRNLCSGSVRQLNNKITAERNVLFYVFALISASDMEFATRSEQMAWVKSLGFTCVEQRKVTADTMEETVQYFSEQVAKNDFPSDGLVLSFDDLKYSKSLGRTAKFPRDSIAFKWKDETARTKLLEIEWSASRTGLINPVAIFEPVELEGTSVSRASIHNVSIMESLQLGIGDEIEVYKANMIIPQIAVNHTKSGTCTPPCTCPVCGKETEISTEGDVKVLYCMNPACLAKKVKSFTLFVSRDAMNMEGISEATLEKWINVGFLQEPADLFRRLSAYRDKIVAMEGFGEKSYENTMASIEKARKTTVERLLYSLGVPGIGVATAKLISKAFSGDIEKIRHATVVELTQINGIGEVMAEAFVDYFADEENQAQLDRILEEVKLEQSGSNAEAVLDGKTFVVTGSVFQFANRKELQAFIEERGGKVASSVSNHTDYLINNDNMSSSSKNKKAKELGIPIITEEEFLAIVGGK